MFAYACWHTFLNTSVAVEGQSAFLLMLIFFFSYLPERKAVQEPEPWSELEEAVEL